MKKMQQSFALNKWHSTAIIAILFLAIQTTALTQTLSEFQAQWSVENWDYRSENWPTDGKYGGLGYTWIGDFNGDGKDDIVSRHYNTLYVKKSNGKGFVSEIWEQNGVFGDDTWVGDFNGDGKDDLVSRAYNKLYMHISDGKSFSSVEWPNNGKFGGSGYTWVGDFNGDGKADLVSRHYGTLNMKISTGTGFDSKEWIANGNFGEKEWTWIGDFNGDGKDDIASRINSNIQMFLSTGTKFTESTWKTNGIFGTPANTWIGDFNGDGKADLASRHYEKLHMNISKGTEFNSEEWPHNGGTFGDNVWVVDFNGDGKDDLVSRYYLELRMFSSLGTRFLGNLYMPNIPGADNWGVPASTFKGDFDGDGKGDIVSIKETNTYVKLARAYPVYPEISDVEKEKLLRLYAPHMRLAEDWTNKNTLKTLGWEGKYDTSLIAYRPSSVDWMMNFVTKKDVQKNGTVWLYPEDMNSPYDQKNYFLGQEVGEATTYGFWIDEPFRKRPWVDIVYFFFYPYNFGKDSNIGYRGFHVGDWEHVTIRLDRKTLKPVALIGSAHEAGNMAAWSKIEMDELRPVVYSAWGSHANYLSVGTFNYKTALSGIVKLYDHTNMGPLWKTEDHLETFDFHQKISLGATSWPLWMNEIGPGAIYRWGNYEWSCNEITKMAGSKQCRLEHGPTGPVAKSQTWDVSKFD